MLMSGGPPSLSRTTTPWPATRSLGRTETDSDETSTEPPKRSPMAVDSRPRSEPGSVTGREKKSPASTATPAIAACVSGLRGARFANVGGTEQEFTPPRT